MIPVFRSLAAASFLAILPGMCLVSCQLDTNNKERNDRAESMTSHEKPLNFAAPKSKAGAAEREKWTTIPRSGGAEYVQSKNRAEDVVSMYGFAHPVAPEVKTIDDLERMLGNDSSMGFSALKKSEVFGIPVLRFEKNIEDTGTSHERMAAALSVSPRPTGKYFTRTRGAFLLAKGKEPQFITLACTRTSMHGEIGSYYEDLFEEYLSAFVADNLMDDSTPPTP